MAQKSILGESKDIDITDMFHNPKGFKHVNELAVDTHTGDVMVFISQGKGTPHKICLFNSDLKEVCPVDKTRTKRLRELELLGLTETINKKIEEKDRTFIHYRLTKRGKNIVSIALKMLEKEN